MSLSEALRIAMANDPIAPILWEPHLKAIDRRVVIVLSAIRECVENANNSFVEPSTATDKSNSSQH